MAKMTVKKTTMNGGDDKYQKKLQNTYKAQTGKSAPKGAKLAASNEQNARTGSGAYKVYIAPTKPSPNASKIKPKVTTKKKS